MESTLSHEVKVGLFALVSLVLFCVSVILLGGDKFFLSHTYELKVRLSQVQGLARGSVVSLSGVPIGNVEKVYFAAGTNEIEMTLTLQKSAQTKITEGALASVKTQGALGDKYIYISPGDPSGKPLAEGATLDIDKTPDLLDIIASKGAELGEVVEIVKQVHLLFENINRDGRSARLMTNLVNSSEQLNLFLTEGRETFKSLRSDAIAPLSSVMKKLDSGQGSLGALINDPSLHNRLMSMLGDAPRNKFLKPLIRDSIETNEAKGK